MLNIESVQERRKVEIEIEQKSELAKHEREMGKKKGGGGGGGD